MYNVSDNYKTYIRKDARRFESKITIGNRTFNNDSIIQIMPNIVQPKAGFSIGNTVSQSIDITLKNDNGVYASVGIAEVEIGLKIGNTIEYIPIGVFNIDSVTKTDYTVKLTCYDNMIKFETGYFSSLADTPTLQEVVNELASITGVEFTGTVPNYTVTKLQGYTCREVLAYVASVCGGNAYITRDGKFTIVYPTEVDCTITAANYISDGYKLEDTEYKIGMITCQNKSSDTSGDDTEDYDSANSKTTISVGSLSSDTMELQFENPWVNESILNDIYNKLKDFSYLGYTLKWQGDLSLDVGDIITVIDKNNVTRKAYVYANKLTYTGGLIGETSAKGETKNSNSFNSSGSSTKDIQRIAVQLLIAEKAIITKANIKDLQAISARIENLDVAIATIDTALINYATVTQLDAVKANVANLNASVANIDSALVNKANVADLTATNATVSNLSVDMANVKTLINGNLTSANIQSLVLTSSKVTVDNGFIKNAMIESLDATKINTGSLNTSKVSVTSSDGSLIIAGATQQFKDSNGKVRLQLGQDASGNFTFILVASDGTTTLIDGAGVKANAIADKLIKANMVADSAIGSQQINYSSFATGFNAATNTNYINASKVSIDLTGQTLDIAFNNINTKVDGVKTKTDTNTTSISAIQGQISTLISNTTITKDGTTTQLKDAYNGTVNTINSMQTTIGQHTTEINANTGNITSLNSSVSSIQASLTSISASLSSTQSTVSNQGTQISSVTATANNALNTANTASSNFATLNTTVTNTINRVSSLELTTSGLSTTVSNVQTTINSLTIGGRNLLRYSSGQYMDASKWSLAAYATNDSFSVYTDSNSCNWYKMIHSVSSTSTGGPYTTLSYPISVGSNKTFTLSFKYKTNGNCNTLRIYLLCENNNSGNFYNDTSNNKTFTNSTTESIFTGTFTLSSSVTRFEFRFDNRDTVTSDSILYIRDIKIEAGNKATDYTPAPEDVDSSIAAIKDYATTTINSVASSIKQTTDSISANVSSLQSSVYSVTTGLNNLQIGGRNLLLNTKSFGGWNFDSYGGNSGTVVTTASSSEIPTGLNVSTCTVMKASFGNSGFRYMYLPNVLLYVKTYTFSAYMYVTNDYSGSQPSIYLDNANRSYYDLTKKGTWQKLSITVTYTSSVSHEVAFALPYSGNVASGTIFITMPKLEEGNQSTTWIPAPEDVDNSISTINTTVSSISNRTASLETSLNGINASITTINSNVSTVTSNLNNLSIGSRNLYINSRTQINYANATKDYTAGYDSTCKAIRVVFGSNPICRFQNVISKNGTYSVSFYAKSNTSSNYTLHCDVCDNYVSNSNGNTVTTSWQYYKFEGFVMGNYSSDTYNFVDIESSVGADILISHLMIVEGSKAMTWIPAPEDVNSSINSIQVGGRNLLPNTGYNLGATKINTYQGSYAFITDTTLNTTVMQITSTGNGVWFAPIINAVNGQQYTESVYLKADKNVVVNFGGEDGGSISCSVTTSWQRFTYTYTSNGGASGNTHIYFSDTSAHVSVYQLKRELGNKVTDWSPAPEDTQSQITTINSNVTTMQSSISTLQSQIALKVEQSNIDSAITTVNNKITATNATISSMQSSINLQLNSITSQVSQTSSNKNLCTNSAFKYDPTTNIAVIGSNPYYGVRDKATYTSWGISAAPVASDYVWHQRFDNAGDNYIYLPYVYAKVKPNTTYTVSFYYLMFDSGTKTFSSTSSYVYGRKAADFGKPTYDNTLAAMPLTYSNSYSNWQRSVVTVTTTSDTDCIIIRFGWNQSAATRTEMLITGVQIEEGSSVTDFVEGTYSAAGTTISQNSSAVMTSFNNISNYFQVSADGAKFGNISSGDYTLMSSSGMQHHINNTNYNYMYITRGVSFSYSNTNSNAGYADVTVNFDSDTIALLNGKIPTVVVANTLFYPGTGVSATGDVYVSSVTSTSATLKVKVYSYYVSVSTSTYVSPGIDTSAGFGTSYSSGSASSYSTVSYVISYSGSVSGSILILA